MCGLTGLYYTHRACDRDRLVAMRDVIAHRGPDDSGEFIEGPLGLGHRRLSIIDIGGGHQPMATADGRFVIVYNGEIYNYRELKQQLSAEGAVFRSNSDTEVILHLHARYGDAGVSRLNGIFAYALWDRQQRRLLLVRDRAGIKPLYFAAGPDGVAFASEIKSLLKSDLVQPRLNQAALPEYLIFRQVAGPHNLFAGVETLPPGHTMEIVDGKASAPRGYWSARTPVTPFTGSYTAAVDATDVMLNQAVQRQLIADVPLGTFCSGGIDSSLTTAIAARHSSQTINTFSVGFHEAEWDETEYARMAAKACGTRHHELRIDEREFARLLPELVWHHDLPLNFANSVHIYAVSKLAREHVIVVLTGEGADELFGGYPRYYIPRMLQQIAALPSPLRAGLLALLGHAPDSRLRKLAAYGRLTEQDQLLFNCSATDPTLVPRTLRSQAKPALDFREECIRLAKAAGMDPVSTLALLDFQTYLVSILDRQDKMSMAASIEARVPFLDNELIDFARSLPLAYKQTYRHRKRVLKDVALRYLPEQIVHRRKSGFGVPLQDWFAGDGAMSGLLTEALQGEQLGELFDRGQLQALHAEHRSRARDHSEFLWSVLNLSLWRRAFAV
jgi:asparagine synthase (glutamine-hydrolysing)